MRRPRFWWWTGPQALHAAQDLTTAPVAGVVAETAPFWLSASETGGPGTGLSPRSRKHVAFSWLRRGPLAGAGWEPAEVPPVLAALTPVASRGRKGEIYLSRALHLCPDDCSEPQICPLTGESRETPLYEELAALEAPVISSRSSPAASWLREWGAFLPEGCWLWPGI